MSSDGSRALEARDGSRPDRCCEPGLAGVRHGIPASYKRRPTERGLPFGSSVHGARISRRQEAVRRHLRRAGRWTGAIRCCCPPTSPSAMGRRCSPLAAKPGVDRPGLPCDLVSLRGKLHGGRRLQEQAGLQGRCAADRNRRALDPRNQGASPRGRVPAAPALPASAQRADIGLLRLRWKLHGGRVLHRLRPGHRASGTALDRGQRNLGQRRASASATRCLRRQRRTELSLVPIGRKLHRCRQLRRWKRGAPRACSSRKRTAHGRLACGLSCPRASGPAIRGPTRRVVLQAVSCSSPGNCTAVGHVQGGSAQGGRPAPDPNGRQVGHRRRSAAAGQPRQASSHSWHAPLPQLGVVRRHRETAPRSAPTWPGVVTQEGLLLTQTDGRWTVAQARLPAEPGASASGRG